MEIARMAALLAPFLPAPLEDAQLRALSTYLDLLLRWNARMNLTGVRDPEHIVTRHFGESLFAAARLLDPGAGLHAMDVGSGAGFPGLPLKIYAPQLRLTLIESQNKKATFLREVVRALALSGVEVFAGRAEAFLTGDVAREPADLVTLRAVERFESVLPVAASLLRKTLPSEDGVMPSDRRPDVGRRESRHLHYHSPGRCRLALLIGAPQVERARDLLPQFAWQTPIALPQSSARVLLIGTPQTS